MCVECEFPQSFPLGCRISMTPVWNNVLMVRLRRPGHAHAQTLRLSDGELNGRLAKLERSCTIQPACSILSLCDQVYGRHFLSVSINAVAGYHRLTVPYSLFFLFRLQHTRSIFKCTSASSYCITKHDSGRSRRLS